MKKQELTPSEYDYTIRSASCARDDFWGQVRRTINGVAVPQEQIDLIVGAINKHLVFHPDDVLLDIGCGNGALTRYFFSQCAGVLGVDRSAYLIEIAKNNFACPPDYTFIQSDALDFIEYTPDPERFTKCLCYGVFSFFSETAAKRLLHNIARRFVNLQALFIGNMRDLELAHRFFKNKAPKNCDLRDHTSSMGCWRTRREMTDMVKNAGMDVGFDKMPEAFYAREYYYDATIYPLNKKAVGCGASQ
jgi:SAM-dependent methyltransferase